jgi:cyclase
MFQARAIPCLLIRENGLVKTKRYREAVYVGDPINAVRIFSEKEADEIIILDIDASRMGREPNYDLIAEMAGEAFMPVTYGGGINSLEQIRCLIRSGVEKVVINSSATKSMDLIVQAVEVFGSQAVVGGVDVQRKLFGDFSIVAKSATIVTRLNLQEHIQSLVKSGVGELFINDVDRDGTMAGYDLDLIRTVTKASVPVVVCGGAGNMQHLSQAVHEAGASAVAAGSIFIFHGNKNAVLINYPSRSELEMVFKGRTP